MSPATLSSAPAGRVKLSNLSVMIDGRQHQIVPAEIRDQPVAGGKVDPIHQFAITEIFDFGTVAAD